MCERYVSYQWWVFSKCVVCTLTVQKKYIHIYHITHSCSGKKVVFTFILELISDISNGSQVDVEAAKLKSRLHTFSHYIPKCTSNTLLTHGNEVRNKIPQKYCMVFLPFKAWTSKKL